MGLFFIGCVWWLGFGGCYAIECSIQGLVFLGIMGGIFCVIGSVLAYLIFMTPTTPPPTPPPAELVADVEMSSCENTGSPCEKIESP